MAVLVTVLVAVLVVGLALVLFAASISRRVERALPPTGTFVEVDGARIHYLDVGDGPLTLVLVHGLGGNAGHFTHSLVERLAREYRVIVMERPGSGYSTRAPGAAAGPIAQAQTVAAFIRALALDRPVLVGHSLGGAVSLATAIAEPSLIRALALVAPLTMLPSEPPAVFKGLEVASPLLRTVIAWTLALPLSIARREATLTAVFGPEPVPRDFAMGGGGVLAMRPKAFVSTSTDFMAVPADMPALIQAYGAMRVPVSVLYGTHDRILDPALHGEAFRALMPQVRVEYVDGAGHMLPLTAPGRVASFVHAVAQG
ncbi:MAG: alpha/beta fold hydrolase [Gemmatimonas sp.]